MQTAVNEKKWADVLAALPALEALPNPTHDDLKAIATWRLQATQGVGDQDAFAAAIEKFLADGYAEPENVGAMHRQLAAHYSAKKDSAKTLEHFQAFVDATPDVQSDELETLGRLHLQAGHNAEGCQYLGKAIDQAKGKNEKPKEMWYQLRDQCFVKLKDDASRLANLEALVAEYPSKEYYSRIVALYQTQTKDDRTVMLNAYRLAVADPQGGLENVGAYLNYADTALVAGSPGEAAARARTRHEGRDRPECRHQSAARGPGESGSRIGQEIASGRARGRGQESEGRGGREDRPRLLQHRRLRAGRRGHQARHRERRRRAPR